MIWDVLVLMWRDFDETRTSEQGIPYWKIVSLWKFEIQDIHIHQIKYRMQTIRLFILLEGTHISIYYDTF